MLINDNDELERFKRRVDLVQLATSYGYEVVRKESCKTSVVMKNEANASRIIVATAQDGHGIFFEVHGNAKGSVIDFVMTREGCSLGKARIILREWTGQPRQTLAREYTKPLPVTSHRAELASTWHRMKNYTGNYLNSRGLSDDTVKEFSHHIKTDDRGNVCFRHDDENGLTGWETKNQGFTGFCGGGKKALFMCNTTALGAEPQRIIITESAIDAMSYVQLSEKPGLFVSFSGALSSSQEAQLTTLLQKYPAATVITATDADAQGENYAVMVHTIRPDALRVRPRLESRPGEKYKDWNDVLMDRPMPPAHKYPAQDRSSAASVAGSPQPLRTPALQRSGRQEHLEPSSER